MSSVVITVSGGVAEVAFQDADVDVTIIDLDDFDLYLYKNYICQVNKINDDGTLDLKCVDTTDGSRNNRNLMNIPAGEISFFSSGEDNYYDEDE
jgi:hypothetical protein